MQIFTNSEFKGYHPNFPIVGSHNVGGVHTKLASVSYALNCSMISDISEATSDLLIEPLSLKPHLHEWNLSVEEQKKCVSDRIESLRKYARRKFLYCTEMEILRWTGDMRRKVLECVERVFVPCRYLQKLLATINVDSVVVYEPTNEYMFYPTHKVPNQIVVTGAPKLLKNTQKIIDVFRALEGKGFNRVYIGSPAMWKFDWEENNHVKDEDLRLYRDLKEVCDVHYKASPATFVARIFSESEYYLNFAYHEVACRTAMEAFMAGVDVIGGDHDLWREYPVIGQTIDVDEIVELLENSDVEKEDRQMQLRQWALQTYSYKRFKERMQDVIYGY